VIDAADPAAGMAEADPAAEKVAADPAAAAVNADIRRINSHRIACGSFFIRLI
jgi:hypothetical protein